MNRLHRFNGETQVEGFCFDAGLLGGSADVIQTNGSDGGDHGVCVDQCQHGCRSDDSNVLAFRVNEFFQ